ncbi:co-chaperone DjlA [Aliikangiella sp. G2MR2-5]|uniref:co-chaperone DjlA n=1 Tax=Aliikangiella sp. G2MR2-5 TaxID=2788943 RepID=UPI0018ABA096|nr:co-chaperone DjlA [Aliikangiella sp. G2MR2-5]
MQITGKIICGLLGLVLGGPIGLILGIWIGHSFDKGLSQNFEPFSVKADPSNAQAVFFESTFSVMGHLAKADGVVTKYEIETAEQIMRNLGISGDKRQQAIEAFQRGKSEHFSLSQTLEELRLNCARSPSLIQMFIEIQILAATSGGSVSAPEMTILYKIGSAFRIPRLQIERLVEMVIAQQSFHRDQNTGQYTASRGPSIEQAYKVLGIESSASKQEVKRAYRKLMAQHHPDKLVSKGMPEEMIKVATEKSQEIQSAYDMIKKQKGY